MINYVFFAQFRQVANKLIPCDLTFILSAGRIAFPQAGQCIQGLMSEGCAGLMSNPCVQRFRRLTAPSPSVQFLQLGSLVRLTWVLVLGGTRSGTRKAWGLEAESGVRNEHGLCEIRPFGLSFVRIFNPLPGHGVWTAWSLLPVYSKKAPSP